MNCRFYLGVDVSKAKLDCLLLDSSDGKRKSKSISNSSEGMVTLLEWLSKHDVALDAVRVIMEPTGVYHEQALLALAQAGLAVSLVNPARLRKYAQGLGIHNKTDAADSAVLARYGAEHHASLRTWQAPAASVSELRALLARRDVVLQDLQRERNRAEKAALAMVTPESVQTSIQNHLDHLQKELARLQKLIREHIDDDPELRRMSELLQSIPGVGKQVSAQMAALLSAHTFEHAEQVAAYLGLVPIEWQSGTSIRARPHLSKAGPPQLRQLLFLPAVAAKACNPHVKAIYERLLAKGKPKMVAVGAAMRKLVHLCFGVVHSGKPYDPNWLAPA